MNHQSSMDEETQEYDRPITSRPPLFSEADGTDTDSEMSNAAAHGGDISEDPINIANSLPEEDEVNSLPSLVNEPMGPHRNVSPSNIRPPPVPPALVPPVTSATTAAAGIGVNGPARTRNRITPVLLQSGYGNLPKKPATPGTPNGPPPIIIDATVGEEDNAAGMEVDNNDTGVVGAVGSENATPVTDTRVFMDDDQNVVCWTDDIFVQLVTGGEVRHLAPKKIIWKGLELTTFIVLNKEWLGCFLGVENPSLLDRTTRVKLRFRYFAIPMDSTFPEDRYDPTELVYGTGNILEYTYEYHLTSSREDYGSRQTFHSDVFKKYLVDSTPNVLNIRIKCLVECLNPSIPRTSRLRGIDTGFVGIANQGATCYLNSLLQVRILFHIYTHIIGTNINTFY